ncbi:MFS transporter [Streptomyces sp. NPDC006879]|uniref:MFS transporter n=1 Tax=Streptomyces sp. NPDC006879 TaxID=3364767 RepID=UPI003690EA1A
MTQTATTRAPLLAVSGDTLIAAAPATAPAARRASAPGPYRKLFAVPGTSAFTLGSLIARLPMGMLSISAVMMIADQRGSYALAGAVSATGLAATGLAAPWVARLVDRHGQARIALPATVLAVLGSLALVLCVRTGAADWTLFASYAATASTPNIGGMARARWAHLLRGDASARHTANSLEQAADELCFMLGPVLAVLLCTLLFPEAGTLTGVALLLVGTVVFTAGRSTEPPVTTATTNGTPLRSARVRGLLVVFLATGAIFGAMEVVSIAFLDQQGSGACAGLVLALQAAGSCAAGLLYGTLRPARVLDRRLRACLVGMTTLMSLPLLAATSGSTPALALALLLAGMATAPTMVTGMTLIQRLTPPDRLNEGMTLAVTALLIGVAVGSGAGGWTVEQAGPLLAYVIPPVAGMLALVAASTRPGRDAGRA